MQEFFVNYGLWLLVGLLVLIGLVFLLSSLGKAKPAVEDEPAAQPVVPLVAMAAPEAVAPLPPESAPAPALPAAPASDSAGKAADDLLKLKGVGPKLNMLLIELGVTSYAQIAGWSDTDVAAIDARLGAFKGRPTRDQWIDQAKYLAAGDIAGFEARYGKM
ncbi:MAG: hypothetical protein ABW039_05605 [Sphingobium sp.]